jgi:hypothetical protein
MIDRDGTIYQAFDAEAWAWQFGLPWRDALRIPFERRFIGIEITSEGGLTEHNGKLYAYGLVSRVFEKKKEEALECAAPYRGYQWFDRYEPAQLAALGALVDDLCTRFAIPRVYPENPYLYYGAGLASFQGIIGHAMVRSDKSDPAPDPNLWQTLRETAGLVPVRILPSTQANRAAATATPAGLHSLMYDNLHRADLMNEAAGSLVIDLLHELEDREVYLKLETPVPGAHAIAYSVAEGDAGKVAPLARALGFKTATDRLLEVKSA